MAVKRDYLALREFLDERGPFRAVIRVIQGSAAANCL